MKAGFVINSSISNWEPRPSLIWLGLEWDLRLATFSVTEARISKFLNIVQQFLNSAPYVTAKACAKIAGHIMSMSSVIGDLARLKTRFIYKVIEGRTSWTTRFNIGVHNDALAEIFYWKNNIKELNLCYIVKYNIPAVLSFSDASSVACGAVISGNNAICHRMWNDLETKQSSTWRELKAIHFALLSFHHLISGKSVRWHSDSQSAVRITQIGSPKPDLHAIAADIFAFCKNHSISFSSEWVPRHVNDYADSISKIIDYDDWCTTHTFFEYLDNLWGPHSIDRFASCKNTHLSRFNSRFLNPGCESVDAFSVSWSGENNWLVPPVYCISRVVQHLIACKGTGSLIVPYWPSSAFWPLLFQDAYRAQACVVNYLVFPDASGIFILGDNKESLIGSQFFNSAVLAIKIQAV